LEVPVSDEEGSISGIRGIVRDLSNGSIIPRPCVPIEEGGADQVRSGWVEELDEVSGVVSVDVIHFEGSHNGEGLGNIGVVGVVTVVPGNHGETLGKVGYNGVVDVGLLVGGVVVVVIIVVVIIIRVIVVVVVIIAAITAIAS
jgi:hypothetical protein